MNKSFTLVEILVVIVVIGALSAFILVGMGSITNSANIAKGQAYANSIRNSLLTNIISEYKFDGLSTAINGTVIGDDWGVNNGTMSTDNTTTEKLRSGAQCVRGKCLDFDGLDDVIDLGAPSSLMPTENISIGAWVKLVSSGSGTAREIWRGQYNSSGHGVLFWVSATNYLYFRVGNGTASQSAISDYPVVYDKWQYFVGTYNSSIVKAYLNGALQATQPSLIGPIVYLGSGSVYIGGGSTADFYGLIDEVIIYNAPVPSSHIQQNYFMGLNKLFKNNGIVMKEYNQRLSELKESLSSK